MCRARKRDFAACLREVRLHGLQLRFRLLDHLPSGAFRIQLSLLRTQQLVELCLNPVTFPLKRQGRCEGRCPRAGPPGLLALVRRSLPLRT